MGDSWRYRRMNNDEIKKLIKARIQHDDLFNQTFYRRNENWAIIRNTANLNDFTAEQLRIKWNYLFKHYKLINPPTGVQTEDGEDTAENWEFFELMHSFGAGRHVLNPPLGLHNKRGAYVRNPQNSFTGNEDHQLSTEPEIITSADLSEDSSTATNSPSTTSETNSADPCCSRQLARNFCRDRAKPKKRISTQQMYQKYLKECKRQKKETKCFFSFLEGFSNHIGVAYRKPLTSESSDSE